MMAAVRFFNHMMAEDTVCPCIQISGGLAQSAGCRFKVQPNPPSQSNPQVIHNYTGQSMLVFDAKQHNLQFKSVY